MGKRGYLAYIIVVLLDLYLADFFFFFSRVYVPDRQLFLDTDSLCSGTVNL